MRPNTGKWARNAPKTPAERPIRRQSGHVSTSNHGRRSFVQTFLRLRVGAGSSGYCNASKDYSFKVNVAPGESEYIGIEPFIPDADAMCVTFLDARAKKQSIYEYIQSVTLPSERPEMLQADPYGAYLNDASIPATEAASAASEVASATAPSSSN